MDILINHVRVLTMDQANSVVEEGFVGIRDGIFGFASEVQPRIMARRFVDGAGKTLIPLDWAQGKGVVCADAPADALLLDGLYTSETIAEAGLSALCMILHDGVICWERTSEA